MTVQKIVFMLLVILLSAYTLTSVRTLFKLSVASNIYLGVVLVSILLWMYVIFVKDPQRVTGSTAERAILISLLAGLLLAQMLWSAVLLVDDIRGFLTYLVKKGIVLSKSFQQPSSPPFAEGVHFSRSLFLQWLGLGIASFLYGVLGWGISNRYNYKVRREQLHLEGLNSTWKGLKMVQLSDIHCGSFSSRDAVIRGVRMVNDIKPDVIFFTGDIVNNRAHELESWKEVFSQLHAPMGIFSVLGNHDYGDYVAWKDERDKRDNLNRLKAIQQEMGWRLLLNEHVVLRKADMPETIALIGVENWSASKRFRRYGDLGKAYKGCELSSLKILLSHDPSHWDSEVLKKFPDIDLMLAGHTHGMQFGLETPFLKWSPIQWVYKQWAGIYRQGKQWLYVNRGFGYIGYMGRVGIMPEITVLELV